MKYLISWTYRFGGSEKENEASISRGLDLFGKWTPHSALTFHAFVGRVDGAGGYALVETDDPGALAEAPNLFGPIAEYQIHPIVDIAESIEFFRRGMDFRESVA